MDIDVQRLLFGGQRLGGLEGLPRRAWVIVSREETALLQRTPLARQAPTFEGRLNDNPLMVFLLK